MYTLQVLAEKILATNLGFEFKQGATFPVSDSLIGKMRGPKNLVRKVSFERQATIQL